MRYLAAAALVVLTAAAGITWYWHQEEQLLDEGELPITRPVPSQRDPEPEPATLQPDPEVKARLSKFKKLVRDLGGTKDAEAVQIIDDILSGFEELHSMDKAALAKVLYEPLRNPRVQRHAANSWLFEASIAGLGKTGTWGSRYLQSAFINKKRFGGKEWLSLRASMLKTLGKTKDLTYVKFLIDEALRNIEDTLMAAAGEALGEFVEADLKVRKQICKELIKKFVNIYEIANANLDVGNQSRKTWEKRYVAVFEPWNGTLAKLTRQQYRTPYDWQRFYNRNKDKSWD